MKKQRKYLFNNTQEASKNFFGGERCDERKSGENEWENYRFLLVYM